MRALLAVVVFALVTAPVAPGVSLIDPMRLTGLCRWLALIRVVEVETISSEVRDGIEYRHVIIRTEVAEVIRGRWPMVDFQFDTVQYRIVDEEEATKSKGQGLAWDISMGLFAYDVSSSREGGLYLLIAPDHVRSSGMEFFYEIQEGSQLFRRCCPVDLKWCLRFVWRCGIAG